jgi:hypothetical protein
MPLLYLLLVVLGAISTTVLLRPQKVSGLVYVPIAVALLYVIPFHLLGLWNLATGAPVVTCGYGSVLLLCFLICLTPFLAVRVPGLSGFDLPVRFVLPPRWIAVLSLLLVSTHGAVILAALSAPPRGFDALWYHLPMAVSWHQTKSLLPTIGSSVEFHPGNAELLLLPLLGGLGNDSWLGLAQYPWLLASAIPVWLLSRELGAGRHTSLLATGAYLTSPLCLYQASHFYVDLVCGACVLFSVLFLVRWRRSGHGMDLVFSGLAGGLALGTKYLAVVPISFLAAIVALDLVRQRNSGFRRRSEIILAMFSYAASLLVPSFFWVFRNAIITGSPVYPIDVATYFDTLRMSGSLRPILGGAAATPASRTISVVVEMGSMYLILPHALWVVVSGRGGIASRGGGMLLAMIVFSMTSLQFIQGDQLRYVLYSIGLTAALLAAVAGAPGGRTKLIRSVLSLTILVNSAVVLHRVFFKDDFDVSWNGLSRNDFYGLAEQIDHLPRGARLLYRGHPTMVYPACGERRDNVVVPSPGGDLVREIGKWSIDYVLVRSYDPNGFREYGERAFLEVLGFRTLPHHHWWGYWPEGKPVFVGLYRVRRDRL